MYRYSPSTTGYCVVRNVDKARGQSLFLRVPRLNSISSQGKKIKKKSVRYETTLQCEHAGQPAVGCDAESHRGWRADRPPVHVRRAVAFVTRQLPRTPPGRLWSGRAFGSGHGPRGAEDRKTIAAPGHGHPPLRPPLIGIHSFRVTGDAGDGRACTEQAMLSPRIGIGGITGVASSFIERFNTYISGLSKVIVGFVYWYGSMMMMMMMMTFFFVLLTFSLTSWTWHFAGADFGRWQIKSVALLTSGSAHVYTKNAQISMSIEVYALKCFNMHKEIIEKCSPHLSKKKKLCLFINKF